MKRMNLNGWMNGPELNFGRDCVNTNRGTTGFHKQTKRFEHLYKTIKAGKLINLPSARLLMKVTPETVHMYVSFHISIGIKSTAMLTGKMSGLSLLICKNLSGLALECSGP